MKIPLAIVALVLPLALAQDAVPDLVCPVPDAPVPGTESACTTECNPTSCSDEGQLCCPTAPLCRDCVTAVRTRSENCELGGEEVEAGSSVMAGDNCNLCVCVAGRIYCTDLSDEDCPATLETSTEDCMYEEQPVAVRELTLVEMESGTCTICLCHGSLLFCREETCGAGVTCEYNGETLNVGDSVDAEDGCNTCTCTANGAVACTEIACGVTCEYNGETLNVGDTVDAEDGCNTCTCTVDGAVACTEIACGGCPDGTQPVTCLIDPCQVSQCPAVEGAECVANYCGGCNAEWFLDGEDVTERCQGGCPDGSEPVSCFINPCDVQQCPAVEGAECEPNYCGGCNAEWFLDGEDVTERCQGGCPDDSPPVNCFIDPCQYAQCPAVQGAECVANYCGGCNAEWFLDGEDVTERCEEGDVCHLPPVVGPCDAVVPSFFFNATSGRCEMFNYGGCGGNDNRFSTRDECRRECGEEEGCPDGTPLVFCFVDPCEVSQCPAVEGAECVANYCGGCNAEWFLNGEDVTERCQGEPDDRYEPNDYASCPPLPEGTFGTCSEDCSSDRDCPERQKCCSNGCGHACFNATFLPYYDAPLACPPAFQAVSLSSDSDSCALECQSDTQCPSGELCCSYGCSSTCQTGQHTGRSCSLIVQRLLERGGREETDEEAEEVGESEEEERRNLYIPQCEEEGTFRPVQFWSDLAWCVNVETGVPIGDPTRNSTPPHCPNCTVNGEVYLVGETFHDECNTCTCTSHGAAICTLRACLDPCSLPVATGTCEDQIQSYYYDSSTSQCQAFSYSGCGGNENRFSSVRDCLHACNPDSVCLLERDEGVPCDDEESPGQLFYYYNSEEGECDTLIYRGCEGNENRFATGPQCLRMCDPSNPGPTDSTGLNCWDIQCDIPFCGEGVEPDYSDAHCCPVCPSEDDCDDDEFRCGDDSCISRDYVCDGLEDCPDGEDESAGCDALPCEFRCSDTQCVPEDYRCDGAMDCDNALDETDCQNDPIGAPYYPPVRVCPTTSDITGACDSSECERDTDCLVGMCCPNNCFQRVCVEPIVDTPICTKVVQRLSSNASYIPQCTAAGDYQSLQCVTTDSARLCWCVNAATGIPFTDTFNDRFPDCNRCRYNGSMYAPGEIYTAVDGCNQCFCSVDGGTICTTVACAPLPCPLGDSLVRHGETMDSECISCTCLYGQLNCTRRVCTLPQEEIDTTIRVEMRFTGDLSQIRVGNGEVEFTREVLRTLIRRYSTSLGLELGQITDVQLREGSVIVIVVIKEGEDQSGADVTILTSQMEQDYMSGSLIIKYNNTALVPDGQYTSEAVQDEDEEDDDAELQTWHIIVIVVAGVAVMLLVLVSITLVCVLQGKKSRSDKFEAEDNDYVREKMEMKADLSAP